MSCIAILVLVDTPMSSPNRLYLITPRYGKCEKKLTIIEDGWPYIKVKHG